MIREITAIASDARIFPRFVYHPELQKICLPVPACSRGDATPRTCFEGGQGIDGTVVSGGEWGGAMVVEAQ